MLPPTGGMQPVHFLPLLGRISRSPAPDLKDTGTVKGTERQAQRLGLYWALAPFRGKRLAPGPRTDPLALGARGGRLAKQAQYVYFIVGVWILKETFKNLASAEACFSISSKVKGSPI